MVQVAGIDDGADWRRTTDAMRAFDFNGDEQSLLLRALAAVLHLGAIQFERVEIKDQATISANISANSAAK